MAEKHLKKASERSKQKTHNLAVFGKFYKETLEFQCLELSEAWHLFCFETIRSIFLRNKVKSVDCIYSNYTYAELSTALHFMKKEYEINPSEKLEEEIKSIELKLKITDKNVMRRNYNCTSGNYPK